MTHDGAAKPRLLFVSPVFPDVTGNGLAMRAGMFLQALSAACDVYLLVVPLYPSGSATSQALIERCTRASGVLPVMPIQHTVLSRFAAAVRPKPEVLSLVEANAPRVVDAFPGVAFDIVHVFRLSMWPVAQEMLRRSQIRPAVHLDLDDIESDTLANIAALRRGNGDTAGARTEEHEAALYNRVERSALAAADRVYVCSEEDGRLVTTLHKTRQVKVVPNAISMPDSELTAHQPSMPFRFLFVGTLGYYPNSDAVVFFQEQVATLLRAETDLAFQLDVVGVGSSDAIQALAGQPGFNLVGRVENVAESYADADAVVIPLRAGGGTRIKALEAFAYKRPVAATTIGIHGINVAHEEHVLIGDTPADFAAQCLRLMQEPALRTRLVDNAHQLVIASYTQGVVADKIRDLFPPPR